MISETELGCVRCRLVGVWQQSRLPESLDVGGMRARVLYRQIGYIITPDVDDLRGQRGINPQC